MPIWDADITGHTKVNHCVTAPARPYFTMSCFLFDLLADTLGAEACVYCIIHLRYLSQKPHGWITHATVNTSPGSSRYQTIARPKHPQSSCIIQLFGEESPGGTIICVITQERNIEKKKYCPLIITLQSVSLKTSCSAPAGRPAPVLLRLVCTQSLRGQRA